METHSWNNYSLDVLVYYLFQRTGCLFFNKISMYITPPLLSYMLRCLETLPLRVSIGYKLLTVVLGLWSEVNNLDHSTIQVPWINLHSYKKETFVPVQIFVTINTDFSPPVTITSSFLHKCQEFVPDTHP
jgi:hypothetical protein